jgi:Domain of unknown function (DUF5753)
MAADSGPGTAVMASLQESVRTPPKYEWWTPVQHSIPRPYLELIEAESKASRITHFHPIFIPGLLQTRAYATKLTSTTTLKPVSPDDVQTLVEVRLRRQRELLHRPDPTRLTAILDESALLRPVGSDATMREQLDHLLQISANGPVTLVVVPAAAGPHAGHLGAFMLIEYDWRGDDVLCFEGQSGNVVIRDQPDLVAGYKHLAGRLIEMGLRNQAATRLVQSARQVFS